MIRERGRRGVPGGSVTRAPRLPEAYAKDLGDTRMCERVCQLPKWDAPPTSDAQLRIDCAVDHCERLLGQLDSRSYVKRSLPAAVLQQDGGNRAQHDPDIEQQTLPTQILQIVSYFRAHIVQTRVVLLIDLRQAR